MTVLEYHVLYPHDPVYSPVVGKRVHNSEDISSRLVVAYENGRIINERADIGTNFRH